MRSATVRPRRTPAATPFHFDLPDASAPAGRLLARLRTPLESLFRFPELNDIYEGAAPAAQRFCERALELLGVAGRVSDADLQRIPKSGPLIVVANHPFGGVDGLLLLAMLQRVRPDVKVLVNRVLARVPELAPSSLFVDAFGGPGAATRNAGAIKAAIHWVRGGGVLGVFPAGEVSHFSLKTGGVADPRWNEIVGRLALRTGATVLPVFFAGHNSLLFQAAGVVHPRLRTALLPRELLRMRGSRVEVRIGTPIPPARIAKFDGGGGDVTAYLRVRTYLLKSRTEARRPNARPLPAVRHEPVEAEQPAQAVAREVGQLPADRMLARSGEYTVLHAAAGEIPTVLREIGRLREITFRAVGEGTGKATDIDRFDAHYRHLFVWHRTRGQVVGAYRMGATDEIVRRFGTDGLYTSTLFHYRPKLLDQIGPALELGRSFVRAEYQREYAPLLLLWRGIAGFVSLHPRYRMLFGPVSISNDYHSLTQQLLVSFLRFNRSLPNLGRLVRPRNAPRFAPVREWDEHSTGTVVRDVAEVDELVGEIESDRLGIPVLLRQYLKLNARLLGFNVDPAFGDVLDALMLVDLTQVEPAILARYMGRVGAEAFFAHHRKS
jgi:putative hemolysin